MLKTNEASDVVLNESVEYADVIAQTIPFYPAACEAIKIALTIPTTTCGTLKFHLVN